MLEDFRTSELFSRLFKMLKTASCRFIDCRDLPHNFEIKIIKIPQELLCNIATIIKSKRKCPLLTCT